MKIKMTGRALRHVIKEVIDMSRLGMFEPTPGVEFDAPKGYDAPQGFEFIQQKTDSTRGYRGGLRTNTLIFRKNGYVTEDDIRRFKTFYPEREIRRTGPNEIHVVDVYDTSG